VWYKRRYYYPPYAPDDPPPSKRPRFDVSGNSTPRRTVASISASEARVETAREEGRIKTAVCTLAQKEGFKGYSLFLFPSPDDKARYPALKYLWEIGPDLLPYDTMHLLLLNVVPRMWELFAGESDKLGEDQPWIIPKAVREAIGREVKAGRRTIPLSQARSLRDISKHSGSYKAVDWMFFLLSVGEVVLADRSPEPHVKMFIQLCHAGRIIFKPGSITKDELRAADRFLKRFCPDFYAHVYAGKEERLRVCRPTVLALLYVTANLRSCGPAWSYWQFPTERLLGTLSRLIRSRRFPYAALTTAITATYSAELVKSFAEAHLAEAWAHATGEPIQHEPKNPAGTFSFSKEPKVDLLPPRSATAPLIGVELDALKAALALEGASNVPAKIYAKKYFRMRLSIGQIAGTVSCSEDADDRRRNHLVRVRSHMWQAARQGRGVIDVLTNVCGEVHRYAVVLINGQPNAYAYFECVRSSVDWYGTSGLPEKRGETECISQLGGTLRYVNVAAIDAVVGTLLVRDRHVVLYLRGVFCSG